MKTLRYLFLSLLTVGVVALFTPQEVFAGDAGEFIRERLEDVRENNSGGGNGGKGNGGKGGNGGNGGKGNGGGFEEGRNGGGNNVPEAVSTVFGLGLALLGIEFVRRKIRK